jgi:hypothetical protein
MPQYTASKQHTHRNFRGRQSQIDRTDKNARQSPDRCYESKYNVNEPYPYLAFECDDEFDNGHSSQCCTNIKQHFRNKETLERQTSASHHSSTPILQSNTHRSNDGQIGIRYRSAWMTESMADGNFNRSGLGKCQYLQHPLLQAMRMSMVQHTVAPIAKPSFLFDRSLLQGHLMYIRVRRHSSIHVNVKATVTVTVCAVLSLGLWPGLYEFSEVILHTPIPRPFQTSAAIGIGYT